MPEAIQGSTAGPGQALKLVQLCIAEVIRRKELQEQAERQVIQETPKRS